MLRAHPEINALYVSWERPALEVIRALNEMGRKDISIFTCDLDYNVALYMAKGEYVRGISSQQPYKQGEAVAVAVAKGTCKRQYRRAAQIYRSCAVQNHSIAFAARVEGNYVGAAAFGN